MTSSDISHFARRLLREQYALALHAEPGALAGRIKPLHDLRVAIRRLRNLLKAFRKVLPKPEADAFEIRLQRLSKRLGPARDMDVWMRTLKSMSPADTDHWRAFIRRQREIQKQEKKALQCALTDPSIRLLKVDFGRFLDQPLSPFPDLTLEKLAAKAIRKSLGQVMDRSWIAPSYSVLKVHRLRIACRRARYTVEFFAEALGRPAARLARQLKTVQDLLGDVHDGDICLIQLRRARHAPPELAAELNRRRRRHMARFDKVWNQLVESMLPFSCQSAAGTAHSAHQ